MSKLSRPCANCKDYLEPRAFPSVYSLMCKACVIDPEFRYRKPLKPPQRTIKTAEDRQKRRLAKYNLSEDEYECLKEMQDNKCRICCASFDEVPDHIDHDHKTGRVRGLLCGTCNNGLGMFQDSVRMLWNAIRYLYRAGNWDKLSDLGKRR